MVRHRGAAVGSAHVGEEAVGERRKHALEMLVEELGLGQVLVQHGHGGALGALAALALAQRLRQQRAQRPQIALHVRHQLPPPALL